MLEIVIIMIILFKLKLKLASIKFEIKRRPILLKKTPIRNPKIVKNKDSKISIIVN